MEIAALYLSRNQQNNDSSWYPVTAIPNQFRTGQFKHLDTLLDFDTYNLIYLTKSDQSGLSDNHDIPILPE